MVRKIGLVSKDIDIAAMVTDISLDDTTGGTDGEVTKAATSNALFDTMTAHVAAATHGALAVLGTKNPPIDADKAIYRDSIASDALVTSTWTQIKAFLKTYFDTLYNLYVHPNHSGEVTSVADGAQTITNSAVTLAKMADMATASLIYRKTAGAGAPEVNTVATLKTDLAIASDISTHAGLTTGIHGVGVSTVESISGSQDKVDTHAGAADPHTVYQKESEKSAVSGYASLDAGTKVPTAELGGAGADNTKYLRGDQSWQVPAGGGAVATDAIWDAKGDLAVGTGANTASKLTVGADDLVLMAASGEATGVKWGSPAGGVSEATVIMWAIIFGG